MKRRQKEVWWLTETRPPDGGQEEGLDVLEVKRVDQDRSVVCQDSIAAEYPLTLFVNGQEWVTLLCTPTNLLELGVGFLHSEGVIRTRADLGDTFVDPERGTVEIEVPDVPLLHEKLRGKRTLTSGCAAGTLFYRITDELDMPRIDSTTGVGVSEIHRLMPAMQREARLFRATGGAHVAALATHDRLITVMEDIGRHNAVDKLIGYAVLQRLSTGDKLLLVSGRVSSELLLKAGRASLPIVISRSAPTSLAVKLAYDIGITLVGFARNYRLNVYSHSERIHFDHPEEGR